MQSIYERCVAVGIEEKWHQILAKGEKTGASSLLAHVLNVMSVAESIMNILNGFSDDDKTKVLAACMIHDSGKVNEDIQKKLSGELRGKFVHKGSDVATTEEKKRILNKIGIPTEFADEIISIDRSMESIESITHKTDILSGATTKEKLRLIVQLADQLVSRKQLQNFDSIREGNLTMALNRLGLHLDYHKVSTIRGVITQLLHNSLSKVYEENGWKAVLYYPDGTVYISKYHEVPLFKRDDLSRSIAQNIENFINNIDYNLLGRAVFGDIRTTVIRTPEFLFFNEDTIRAFWKYIAIANFVKNPPLPPDKKDKYSRLLKVKRDDEEAILMLRFKKVRSAAYLSHIMKEIVKLAASYDNDKAWSIFEEAIQHHRESPELIKDMKTIASTSEPEKVVRLYDMLVQSKVVVGEKLEEIQTSLIDLYTKITLKLWKEVVSGNSSTLAQYANKLLEDIERPLMMDVKDVSISLVRNYSHGKSKGTVFCPFCSSIPQNEASEPLVGKGVESFQNAISGGSRLGGKNKAKLCLLCEMEAKIRSVFVSDNAEAILVLPQLNLSHVMRTKWQEILHDLFNGLQTLGIRPMDERYWVDAILNGQINGTATSILKIIKESNRKDVIRRYARFFEDTYVDIATFQELTEVKVESKDFQELAEMLYDGRLQLSTETSRQIKVQLVTATNTHISYESPNFLLITLGNPIGRNEESETSSIIRKVFIGLLTARLFLASVVFPDIPLAVYHYSETPKGYLRLPMKLGLFDVYTKLGIQSWVHTDQIDHVLRQIATCLKIESILFGSGSDYGKDTLLQIFKKEPGEVLNRHLQIKHEFHRTLYTCLNEVSMQKV